MNIYFSSTVTQLVSQACQACQTHQSGVAKDEMLIGHYISTFNCL